MDNKVVKLFGIKYPIIQGGMIWTSGWQLASAVSNAGGLGVIGAGSMYPEVLKEHILKCKKATSKPFGVNVPMLYPNVEEILKICIDLGVKIIFTSAGNPKIWTGFLKANGINVVHVVSSLKFALKAQEAGVDAIVGEGFEAGGHNGRDESTTLTLLPLLKEHIKIPLIAAGGIATGEAMLAALVLGADGVQLGSRFVACKEASCHEAFKNLIVNSKEGDTKLTLKELAPVRLLKNKFYRDVEASYKSGSTIEELRELLGKGRAKKGMFLGDLDEGELEIGQVSALLKDIKSAKEIIDTMVQEFKNAQQKLKSYSI